MNRTPGRFSSCQKFTELLMIEGQVPHFLCDFHDELHVLEPSFGAKFVYCSLRTATKRFQAGDRCAMDSGVFFFLMGFGTGVSPSVSAGPKESIMGAPQSLSAAPLSGHTPWTKFLPLLLLAWLLLFTWMPIWKATV